MQDKQFVASARVQTQVNIQYIKRIDLSLLVCGNILQT